MADVQSQGSQTQDDDGFYAGDPHDPSSYKKFPYKPSTMQSISEAFQPDSTRIMIDQIRKRRQAASGG